MSEEVMRRACRRMSIELDNRQETIHTLRAKIEALEKEPIVIAETLGCHRAYIIETIIELTERANRTPGADEYRQLQAQLAAMTQERDMARATARGIITKLEAERDAANEERQRAVDSLAKYIEHDKAMEELALYQSQQCFKEWL